MPYIIIGSNSVRYYIFFTSFIGNISYNCLIMYIIFLNLLDIEFICIFHFMSEHISKPKYLWFLTMITDLQEHESSILH